MVADIVRWWLILVLLGLIGLPLSLWFFRRLPDHGLSLSKPFGILLVGYGAWLLTTLGFGSFGLRLIVFVALAVCAGGIWACRRSGIAIRATLRAQGWWWAFHEGLFAAALFVGLVLRWHSPWGFYISHTEMPMDFMFLNGILASKAFPPQDPWVAGYPINYYYFGYLLIALLTRLSGLVSAVTFTLALPTIFALTATTVAGIVWNATGLGLRPLAAAEPNTELPTAELAPAAPASAPAVEPESLTPVARLLPAHAGAWLRLACATLAAILVLLMGNQMAAAIALTGTSQVVSFDGG